MNKTKLIILGAAHSLQLASRKHHAGVYRAFFESVKPDVICIERSPKKYLKSDYYEFTYEQQYLTIPYALEKGIPIYPIDWLPSYEDDTLVYGISLDHDEPPIIRTKNEFFRKHGCVPHHQILDLDFFFADDYLNNELLKRDQEGLDIRRPGFDDYWRRLVLYRTFMQAMKIIEVVKKHKGETVLVVIGAFHKPDIENILIDSNEVEIVQPSEYGVISNDESPLFRDELFAIATYNLLGVQTKYGVVDWQWVEFILNELESSYRSSEVKLLRTRYDVLRDNITNEEAVELYKEVISESTYEQKLTFHGVKYKHRIDSYFDPFGYLSIKQRAELELAREYHKLNLHHKMNEIKKAILDSNYLSLIQKTQIEGYWNEYLSNMKR